MQSIGAEQPVVVKKLRNGSGAKGLCYLVLKIGQPIREELMDKIKSFGESFKRLDNGSRMNREVQVRLCVQIRLACSAGVSPAGVKVRTP